MKHRPLSQATIHDNSSTCTVYEYGAGDQLDMAVAEINGRYPEQGYVSNEVSEEAVYVIAGIGRLVTKDSEVALAPGDAAFIAANEAYYFEGDKLKVAISCTPPWSPAQHKEVA